MTEATPEDVREVIDTGLDDADIQTYIDRAAEDNERVNKTAQMDSTQLRRIEELLASIKILSYNDRERSKTQQAVGNANKTFEVGKIRQLRAELSNWDPSDQLGTSVVRDSSRNVSTTGDE